jgi:hypothetical protein
MLAFSFGKNLLPKYFCVKAEYIGSEIRATVTLEMLKPMLKNIIIQYIIGILPALLILPFIKGIVLLFPDISWKHLVMSIIITVFIFQILFYYLTSNRNNVWTIRSFITNYFLWVIELSFINNILSDPNTSWDRDFDGVIFILFGLLWVTNKILIDNLLGLHNFIGKFKSKIELITENGKSFWTSIIPHTFIFVFYISFLLNFSKALTGQDGFGVIQFGLFVFFIIVHFITWFTYRLITLKQKQKN